MNLKKSLLLVLIFYLIYSSFFIYRTSCYIDKKLWFLLFDDAMISMRYAKNLSSGYGLVWNIGENPIEGFTNPLWTLFMVIPHILHIPENYICLFIQITGIIFIIFIGIYVFKITELLKCDKFTKFLSVILTIFYLPLNYWTLMGMEVGILTLIILIITYKIFFSLENKKFNFIPYLLSGILILIRIDTLFILLFITLFMFIVDYNNKIKHLISGILIFITFFVGQELFRFFYFNDLLPNTYYLKMTGYPFFLRIARGFLVYLSFVYFMNPILFLIPFIAVYFLRNIKLIFLLILFSIQSLYSIYVGGDAWEMWGGSNRYISIVMPQFFIIYSIGLKSFLLYLKEKFFIIFDKNQMVKKSILLLIAFLSLLSFNSLKGISSLKEFFLIIKPTLHIKSNEMLLNRALFIKNTTTKDALIAVTAAGIVPYFTDKKCHDILGKNDRIIAKTKMKTPDKSMKLLDKLKYFYPGHLKSNYFYSLIYLKPDVIEIWHAPDTIFTYLNNNYTNVYGNIWYKKNSKNIIWDKINENLIIYEKFK